MLQNISYPNTHFGKHNWFYWPSFLLLVGPFLGSILFLVLSLKSGYELLVRLIIFLGFLFFLNITLKGFSVLRLSFKVVSKATIIDNGVELVTYPGSTVRLDSASVIEEVTDRFSKKHHQLIFPTGCCVYRVVSDDKEYYLPIAKEYTFYLDKLKKV